MRYNSHSNELNVGTQNLNFQCQNLTVSNRGDGEKSPPEGVDVAPVLLFLLGKVDERGEGEHGHGDEHDQQAELLVSLLESAEERLEPSKVSHQLEDSQDSGDADQTKDLAGLADDVELGQVVDQERDEVGQDGKEVDLRSI